MIHASELWRYIIDHKNNNVLFISALVSLAILTMMIVYSGTEQLFGSLEQFRLTMFLAIFLIFLAMLLIVAFRLKLALRSTGPASFSQCFDISIFHIVLLSLLPARLGDVCYPFILRQNLSIDIPKAISNLLIIRIYDFLVVCFLFIIAILLNSTQIESSNRYVQIVMLLVAGFLLVSGGAYWLINRHLTKATYVTNVGKMATLMNQTRKAISDYSCYDHVCILAMTVCRWLMACLLFLFIFKGLNIQLTPAQAILITTGINLAVLLPIQTMGGFGITEAVMAWFLGILGYPVVMAISLALASRIIWLIFPFLIAGTWLAVRKSLLPG